MSSRRRSNAWPACATRASSRPTSTRPRSAICWSGCSRVVTALGALPDGIYGAELDRRIREASEAIEERPRRQPRPWHARVSWRVLGSGLGGVSSCSLPKAAQRIPYRDIPHLPARWRRGPCRRADRRHGGRHAGHGALGPSTSVRGLLPSGVDPPAAGGIALGRRHRGAHQRRRRPRSRLRARAT